MGESSLKLFLACQNLPNRSSSVLPDAFAEASLTTVGIQDVKTRRTETIKSTINPQFKKPILVEFYFEKIQNLNVKFFDEEGSKKTLLGASSCEIGDIVVAKGQQIVLPITTPTGLRVRPGAVCVISVEEIKISQKDDKAPKSINLDEVKQLPPSEMKTLLHKIPKEISVEDRSIYIGWHGSNLDKMDTFGLSDPYFKVYRSFQDRMEKKLVYQSEIIKKTLNPTWKPFEVRLEELCGNNLDLKITIECWDWDFGTEHDLIGEFDITVNELLTAVAGLSFELINPIKKINEKKKKEFIGYRNSGVLVLDVISINSRFVKQPNPVYQSVADLVSRATPTVPRATGDFIQFLAGGLEISLIYGIDFTTCNGNPEGPYYYHAQGQTNLYREPIKKVNEIFRPYCGDRKVSVFGFGGTTKDGTAERFSLGALLQNKDPSDLTIACDNVKQVMEAYESAITKVTPGDMTKVLNAKTGKNHMKCDFHPLLASILGQIREEKKEKEKSISRYYILVLFVSGDEFDLNATFNQLIKACTLPISVFVIGLGSNLFINSQKLYNSDQQNTLNIDCGPLPTKTESESKQSSGITIDRPLMHFTKLDSSGVSNMGVKTTTLTKLTSDLFIHAPYQIVTFLKKNFIEPKEKIKPESSTIVES